MEELDLIIESIKPEQYLEFYKDLPLPSSAVRHDIKGYIEVIGNDEYQKKILTSLVKNKLHICGAVNNKIEFFVDLNNGSIVKYLREHINTDGITIDVKGMTSKVIKVSISYSNERDIQVINQIIDNYYLANVPKSNEESDGYIMNLYQQSPKENLQRLKELNKNELVYLKEKHLQESVLPFNEQSDLEMNNTFNNEASIRDIYNTDKKFGGIPLDKLNNEQKMIMCNNYFRKITKNRLNEFVSKLKESFGVDFNVVYSTQCEYGQDNYGISGNLRPEEEGKNEMLVSMYPNINYCSLNGDKAIINEDLIGQIMITILHEHEHLLQRNKMINSALQIAIESFENKFPSGSSSYYEHYKNDPAEIDANISSFDRLIEMSKSFNINNPENIILKRVDNVSNNAEDLMNFYEKNKFNNYPDVKLYLLKQLENSIISCTDLENANKTI